jgi:hypothetical protein
MPLLPLPILLPPLLPFQLICGALTAWMFREKGRPVWAGALLGVTLGLVGLVIAAALSGEHADREKAAV